MRFVPARRRTMNLAWHVNRLIRRRLWLLNLLRARLTVTSYFRSPGDTLLAANLCRTIKARHPRIRINCQVEHPELLRFDPAIDELNGPAGFWRTEFEYLEMLERKDGALQVLAPSLRKLGIERCEYKARVYLTAEEIARGKERVRELRRPIVTINVMSREAAKIWPLPNWQTVVRELARDFSIVQLGDESEPPFEEAASFAGRLSMRESMAVLAHASIHVGPDSFLMHAANGLDVPSVIVFGGSRTDRNLGYAGNENLYRKTDCGPCYLHSSKGERCGHGMKCMEEISPEEVLSAFWRLRELAEGRAASRVP